MEFFLFNGLLYLIAIIAVIGVFAPHLDDTLMQRIGLACICIGALGLAGWALKNDPPFVLGLMVAGVAFFMVATAFKLYKQFMVMKDKTDRRDHNVMFLKNSRKMK
jgi:hypothetical protein